MLTPAVYAASLATRGLIGDVDDLLRGSIKSKGKGKNIRKGEHLSADQNALKNLLKERKRTGKPLDAKDVDIVNEWADETGLIFRDDRGTAIG